MSRADLESIIDRQLRRLPPPAAPDTLLPRVMAAVRAWSVRPWYQRTWFTWPIGLQVASLALFAGAILGAGVALPWSVLALDRFAGTAVSVATRDVPDLSARLSAVSSAVQVVWHALVHPVLVYAAVVVCVLFAACVTVAVALNHVVFGRTVHS
jgi:hypothetical protein